jgi:pimeloyl-ACP methyl ester carboxylesterase
MPNFADHDTYRILASRTLMHVRDWHGDGPPVLFLHGFTANSLLALRLGRLLSPQRRLIAPDLRGRGKSDIPFGEYGVEIHLKEISALINRLRLDKVVLAGHSFGAMLAVFLAARMPEHVESLILFDGGVLPDPLAAQALDAYYSTLNYHYASEEDYIGRFRQSPLYQPWTPELEYLVRSNLYAQPDGTFTRSVPRYVVETERTPANLAIWETLPNQYPSIACPVLVVRAGMGVISTDDPVISDAVLEKLKQALPQAKAVTIPEAAHTSLLTIPSPNRDQAILEFLKVHVNTKK